MGTVIHCTTTVQSHYWRNYRQETIRYDCCPVWSTIVQCGSTMGLF